MITINIQKKEMYLLSAIIVFLVGVGIIIAYNSGADPSIMGHDIDEIDWSKNISQLNALDFCLSGNCKTEWPSEGGNLWTPSGDNIYYNNGMVGIGTTPNYKLDVEGDIHITGTNKFYAPEICLSGDCKTNWPTSGGGIFSYYKTPLSSTDWVRLGQSSYWAGGKWRFGLVVTESYVGNGASTQLERVITTGELYAAITQDYTYPGVADYLYSVSINPAWVPGDCRTNYKDNIDFSQIPIEVSYSMGNCLIKVRLGVGFNSDKTGLFIRSTDNNYRCYTQLHTVTYNAITDELQQ